MKKIYFIKLILIIFNIIVIIRLFDIMIINKEYYKSLENETYIYGSAAPRGRILDINGNILVDNKGIKYLKYDSINDNTVNTIKTLANILSIDNINVSNKDKKNYYYFINKDNIDNMLDDNIIDKYNSKLIDDEYFLDYKYSFISDDDINNLNELEVYIYKMIINNKVIKNNITNEEFSLINEINDTSIIIDITWVREYLYDTSLNQLFGTIGSIPAETKAEYLNNGYSLDDIVGLSYLEKEYDEYLRGKRSIKKILANGEYEIIQEEEKGNDLVLNIDINLQLEIDELLKNEIKEVKKYISSKYYDGTYVIISNVDGSIVSISGYKYDDEFVYNTIGTLLNSYTVGSVVKGASMAVAYKYNVISESKIKDGCVKLLNQKEKCSWTKLGMIDDIDALAYSSNYYQFINAIKVTNQEYKYNMEFNVTLDDFLLYRNIFKKFGLGSYSGIDLSEEKLGIVGNIVSGDLLLNYVIGQYDTYTPLMLTSYINTIANDGIRYNLRLGSYFINSDGEKVNINEQIVLDNIDIDLSRIKKGFESVIEYGTASSYVNNISAGGKTGTSENYINGDKTYTKSFIMYLPADDPLYTVTIVSPNISYKNDINNTSYSINSHLSRKISNILFEK